MSDNYLFQQGGPGLYHLRQCAEKHKPLLHGVGLNIAGSTALDLNYLSELKKLSDELSPVLVSDHLCFTRNETRNSYDLLPFPYTKKTLAYVAERVQRVQDFLKRQISIENVSSYIRFLESDRTEFDFLSELCDVTGCGILLDVNNLFVCATNHHLCPETELQKLSPTAVTQFHVAGHTAYDSYLHDTHDKPVSQSVWQLLHLALSRFGMHPVILERDDDVTSFDDCVNELTSGLLQTTQFTSEVLVNTYFSNRPQDASVPVENLQSLFLEIIQAPPHLDVETLLNQNIDFKTHVEVSSLERLNAYRHGYYGRVVSVLASTIFEPAARVIGQNVLEEKLADFFTKNPAGDSQLVEAASAISKYYAESEKSLAELFEMCLLRWKVLIGPDPVPLSQSNNLELIFLQTAAKFKQKNKNNQSVLLFKSAPYALESLLVPQSLVAFVKHLQTGHSVAKSLEYCEKTCEDLPNNSELSEFIATVASKNGFQNSVR